MIPATGMRILRNKGYKWRFLAATTAQIYPKPGGLDENINKNQTKDEYCIHSIPVYMMPFFMTHEAGALHYACSLIRKTPRGMVIVNRAPIPGLPFSQIVISVRDRISRTRKSPTPPVIPVLRSNILFF